MLVCLLGVLFLDVSRKECALSALVVEWAEMRRSGYGTYLQYYCTTQYKVEELV